MTLTPEQKAEGWRLHDGSDVCPIKDERTVHQVMKPDGRVSDPMDCASGWNWRAKIAYRIIEAHGADAEPARPTPFPASYDDLVFSPDGWSQTIIVDGKRPEWLRDDDRCTLFVRPDMDWSAREFCELVAIRVRRREPKRETVGISLEDRAAAPRFQLFGTIDLIDGKPDLSTLKIAEDAL